MVDFEKQIKLTIAIEMIIVRRHVSMHGVFTKLPDSRSMLGSMR